MRQLIVLLFTFAGFTSMGRGAYAAPPEDDAAEASVEDTATPPWEDGTEELAPVELEVSVVVDVAAGVQRTAIRFASPDRVRSGAYAREGRGPVSGSDPDDVDPEDTFGVDWVVPVLPERFRGNPKVCWGILAGGLGAGIAAAAPDPSKVEVPSGFVLETRLVPELTVYPIDLTPKNICDGDFALAEIRDVAHRLRARLSELRGDQVRMISIGGDRWLVDLDGESIVIDASDPQVWIIMDAHGNVRSKVSVGTFKIGDGDAHLWPGTPRP